MDWAKYIGMRVLVNTVEVFPKLLEVKVLEVSPSNNYVKFRFHSGLESWNKPNTYKFVEALVDSKRGK